MSKKKHDDAFVDPEPREYEGPTGLPVQAGGSKVGSKGPSGLPEQAGGSHSGQPGASGLPPQAGGHPAGHPGDDDTEEEAK
ncbi:hypothetical protein VR010_13965 [Actinomycetaceae bacterium L2_0104]